MVIHGSGLRIARIEPNHGDIGADHTSCGRRTTDAKCQILIQRNDSLKLQGNLVVGSVDSPGNMETIWYQHFAVIQALETMKI